MTCVLLKRGTSGSSLASYARTAVAMLHAAERQGLRGHVDLRQGGPQLCEDPAARDIHGDNLWQWYFEQPCVTAEEAAGAPLSWEWHEGEWEIGSWPDATPRAVVARYLRPNDLVRHHAAVLFSAHGLDPARTIAVSHRQAAGAAPIEAYYQTIDGLLAGDATLRLWAQPEQTQVTDALAARYGARCTTMAGFAPPDADRGYERGLRAATLLAMFAACRCC